MIYSLLIWMRVMGEDKDYKGNMKHSCTTKWYKTVYGCRKRIFFLNAYFLETQYYDNAK